MNDKTIGPALALGAASAAMLLTGCGGKAGASGDKTETIGLTVQSIANPYFVAIQRGVADEARRTGARVALQDGREDIGNQTDIMDNFDVQQVNLIVLNTVDTVGIGPAVTRVHKDGIPIVAVDAEADGGTDATVISDNEQAGRLVGEYLAKRLGGKGSIAVVDSIPAKGTTLRNNGFSSAIAKFPGIKVVARQITDGSKEQGLDKATDILTANPHLDAIFTLNDQLATGTALAAKQAGRKDFFIVSVDGSPDAVADMKAHGLIAATSAQDPHRLGELAVQVGQQIIAGRKPASIVLPVHLVTQDNVGSYKGW